MGWSADNIPALNGRIALVTGANIGLGLETTRQLALKGARVVMACRNPERAAIARQQLIDDGCTGLEVLELDLGDLQSVRSAVAVIQDRIPQLDLLINNAGVMAPPRRLSPQGHEWQLAVNHLGHMALTEGLLPLMASSPDPRVVTVTSGAQYFGTIRWDDLNWSQRYDRYGAYAQSKLANVMFALELDARLREQNSPVRSLAAHPGLAHQPPTHRVGECRSASGSIWRPPDAAPVPECGHGCPTAAACCDGSDGARRRALWPGPLRGPSGIPDPLPHRRHGPRPIPTATTLGRQSGAD